MPSPRCGGWPNPLDASAGLRELAGYSLVEPLPGGERARLHPLLAAFAAEQLAPGDVGGGQDTLVTYYQQFMIPFIRIGNMTPAEGNAIADEWPALLAVAGWAAARGNDAALAESPMASAAFLISGAIGVTSARTSCKRVSLRPNGWAARTARPIFCWG